jgi:hypothetical protein
VVAFPTSVIFYLTIPTNATTGQRIVLDGINGAILVYDSLNDLIASVASGPGTDTAGNPWVAGFTSYNGSAHSNYAQLFNGELTLNTPLDTVAGGVVVVDNNGPNGDQPETQVFSPAYSGFPQPNAAYVQLFGANATDSEAPYVRIGARGGPASDMNVLISGQLVYSSPSSLGNGPEIWHQVGNAGEPAFNANWSNTGAPWGNLKFTRTANNTVKLTGVVQWGDGAVAAPQTIFTLPVGYRPNRQIMQPIIVLAANASTPQVESIVVTTAGLVQLTCYPAGGPNTPITLEGFEFDLAT